MILYLEPLKQTKTMKTVLAFALSALALTSLTSFAPTSTCTLTVSHKFVNVVAGYDHQTKTIVYVDGNQVAETSVKLETQQNSVSAVVPCGKHHVRIVNYAYYELEGDPIWEEHTTANDYSIDCLWEGEVTIKKKTKINLLFDIDCGTKVVKKFKSKEKPC